MNTRTNSLAERLFSYAVMLFTVIVSTFPIVWIVVSSFKTNKAILGDPFALPSSISFKAYADVFTQYNFLIYFKNSLIIATTSTLIAVFIYALAGYIFGKFDFFGKNVLFILCTITLLVPGYARAQPIFTIVMKLNLYDTKTGLVLVYASFGMALALFILRVTFMSIPKDLDEAAIIDGAGFWRIFWHVNLPLAKSGLATSGILLFLANWNEYFYALVLTTSEANRTLPVALGFFNEAFSYNYTYMFAALTMIIIPGIVIYLLVQEQVQQSVASSGVKG
ncbi:sugar ABC transporter permease [Paenibacillus darwinianus]|uniref:Sugar ABC transporter permease n=1 Tax=Paenibacillus darwinianus TaxID=1380763 RepID=A0A9W5RZA4_9BACL|nr:carbohydrate ABC transporter permease [Paenibacillus darwinianus]EXX85292.1 sugar ABC transporter permease [Paenibacillus darwinianus]EXX85515.1 sugar ABC transporter permease [Paenibacillus darwinianus]EXX85529.1 sugar ABC transporter permease [Paenibacillus darwinianus]